MNNLDKTAHLVSRLILLRLYHENSLDSDVPIIREAYRKEAERGLKKLREDHPDKDLVELVATNQYMPKNLEDEARRFLNEILKA